jgi:hypothetical protein
VTLDSEDDIMEVSQTEETGLDETVDLSEEEEEVVELSQEGQLADGSQIQLEFSKETARLSHYPTLTVPVLWQCSSMPWVYSLFLPLFLKN